jgi:two-component system, cell cycle sensor histidine kinase and response regulator CckA
MRPNFEDFLMAKKPTYEEFGQRVNELENEAFGWKQMEAILKENELKLRASERELKSILHHSPDIIYRLDPKGAITYVNETVKEYDYSKEDLIGKNILEFIHPDDREKAVYRVNERRTGDRSTKSFEIRLLRKDLAYVPFENKSRGFEAVLIDAEGIYNPENAEINSFVGTQGIIRDISERRRAEEALRESENKFRTVFDTSPHAIAIAEIKTGKLVDVNDKFCGLTKNTKEEVIGRTAIQLGFYSENDRNRFVNELTNSGKVDELEMDFKAKDGSIINTRIFAVPIQFEGEVYVLTEFYDVTEQKKLDAQLQHAQKMEAIGTLAGGVAHDLNNILGGLVSYPELLLLQLPGDSPLRKSILTIQKSGEKAAAVVQDLLTLARRGVIVTEVVNLNDVISEYLESPEYEKLQSYHPAVHLEAHLQKDVLNILGSSTHLSKTVMNLVSNAAEAMPEGGNLTVSTENRYIDRPIRGYDNVKEGDYVVLTMSDTGTGISPDDMEKIFEPFYTKKKMGRSGTGLGMAVVWGTVKDHNGYIHVQSTEGKGTTFTLYFPVTREGLPEDESELAIESYGANGESILIVDDVAEQREIASGMLKELGYSVVSVSSGEGAVEYLTTHKADLLLLDMIMAPGMDGLDTYKKILEIHPEQKTIITSGFSETTRVKEVQSMGAGAYIRKPFLLENIGLAVKKELEK